MKQNLKRHFAARLPARIAAFAAGALTAWSLAATPAAAEAPDFTFRTIDGASLTLSDLRGAPVLLINTAMQDGYSVQLSGVKDLAKEYGGGDLTIILTPRVEVKGAVSSARSLSYFYRDLYGLKMPITYPVAVEGPDAHPFYAWLRKEAGQRVRWNFNKILLNADGEIERIFGAEVWPTDHRITRPVADHVEIAQLAREAEATKLAEAPAADGENVTGEADIVVAALAPSGDGHPATVRRDETPIVGEIASAEMWPPAPTPRPDTLMREDFEVATGPWPPAPTPRPETGGQIAATGQMSAREQFVLSSAD